MIHYLQELGFTDSEGQGLSYSEIQSWSSLTGSVLNSWEVVTLKNLSSDFAVWMQKKDIDEPSPYTTDIQ